MSKIMSLMLERKTSKDEMFSLLQLMGGNIQTNAADQVVLEDSEGAVWCYYRGENFNLDEKEQLELKKYSAGCNTELALELSSDENSGRLAEKICKKIMEDFGACIIYSDDCSFHEMDQLHEVVYS